MWPVSIVLESERPSTVAAHDIYLVRLIEPHVTESFATLVHGREDKYGAPDDHNSSVITKLLQCHHDGDQIDYLAIGTMMSLDYKQLIDADNKGL